MIYYCCKDITPLKVSLSKIIFEVQKDDNTKTLKQSLFLNQTIRPLKTNETGRKKGNFPPKRGKLKKIKNNSFEKNDGKTDDIKLIDLVK